MNTYSGNDIVNIGSGIAMPLDIIVVPESRLDEYVALPGLIYREKIVSIHVEKLPEGYYLATSDDIQGLVAQGRTVTEALECARDVARRLIEARAERRNKALKLKSVTKSFDLQLVIGG